MLMMVQVECLTGTAYRLGHSGDGSGCIVDTMKANTIVHWPGKDVLACHRHTARLTKLARAFNFRLLTTRCDPVMRCQFCEKEDVKLEPPAFQQLCSDSFSYDLS